MLLTKKESCGIIKKILSLREQADGIKEGEM